MTDYQILTIIAAFIIVDIAVLSLVAIPLLRRRLASRIEKAASAPPPPLALPSDPLGAVSASRLAAVTGARPTLSAPVPTVTDLANGAIDPDDLPIGAAPAETGENAGSDRAPDVVEAITAARAATEAWQRSDGSTDTGTHTGDAQEEAVDMDSTEMSIARARGSAIHPEDPLVASTIDRLLGARREAEASALSAAGEEAGATMPSVRIDGELAEATGLSGTTDASGTTGETGAGAGLAETQADADEAETGTDIGSGRPVMASAAYATEGLPEPTIDSETGLDSPLSWAMAITIEQARSSRYGRPVSVVIAELDGFELLAELFGPEAADRLIPPVADALRRSARAADRVARLSRTRFGVLLVETDEIRAINYVERVRASCDRWLEASAIALRLSIGWASPATDGDLRSAVRIAEDRMYREQHRPAPWRPAAAVPAPVPAPSAAPKASLTPED